MRGARGASPPSLLDQIEARGAEKVFWETAPPPLSKGLDDCPLPPICLYYYMLCLSIACCF